ncbi:hypothetical protein Ocin01_06163 [Orchesella cincta]|uniref:Uncharacterized protein n=1 Tax=Orchesella cincta TaxID=48709 RepID=A0A1D2N5G2_ORCCI|nr:hypothetical protein Ocin01_06163 [Orchesella cincta]
MMGMSMAAYWMLIIVTIASVTGKPASTMRTHKRQSDQRVAELETLLALQKYGAHHFLRAQSSDGGGFFPGYGIIDFNKIGRKKKSSSQSHEALDWALPSWLAPNPSSDTRLSSRNWKETLDPVTTGSDPVEGDDDEN